MIAAAANLTWLATQGGAYRRFQRSLNSPGETQERVLRGLLRRHAGSAFGQHHDFAGIRTAAEFTARVPLASYGDIEPWIRRIMRGEKSVLTTDEVTHLVPTSGSSSARKLIPFTAGLQSEFNAAIGPWVSELFWQYPSALFGPAYWSISPGLADSGQGESSPSIGFEDDTVYLGGPQRKLVAATLAAPSWLREIKDMESFFLLTLVFLLRRRDLRIISVWHPSYLLLLLAALGRHWETLADILHHGRLPEAVALPERIRGTLDLRASPRRAAEIRHIGPGRPRELWPDLAVISCWADAHAALGAARLAGLFPGVVMQPKGLIATEAIVTIPFYGLHPVALESHYFEFMDNAGNIRPLQALREGETCEVVVTTGGGLWRYRLGDRVRVDGFVRRTPSLRFLGRSGNVSDLFGEKLSEEFVSEIIRRLVGLEAGAVRFVTLSPSLEDSTGVYTLYWESDSVTVPSAKYLDDLLSENPHYKWCRQLGQLLPAKVMLVASDATAAYYQHSTANNRHLGGLKPPCLTLTTDWLRSLHLTDPHA